MATSLFKLVGSIFVDTEEANNSLQKTTEKAESTGVSFGQVAGKAAAIGTAVVAAAGAAVTGITALASNAAETADTIDKASIRMGVSAEEYQKLAYAAGMAGVETSTLERAAKALEGTDISFDDAMAQIMSFETAEERAAAAAELFGEKVAYDMSPMIEQSAEAFEASKQEAEDLGLVLSGDTVKAGAELGDTMDKVKQSFQAIATNLGAALMPLIQKVADFILDKMPMIQGWMDQLIPVAETLFETLLPPLMDLAEQLLPVLAGLMESILPIIGQLAADIIPIIVELLGIFLPIFMEIVEKLLPPLLSIIEALLPVITIVLNVLSPILDVLMAILDPFAVLLEALSPLITVLLQLIELTLKPIEPLLVLIAEALSFLLTGAMEGLTVAVEFIGEAFEWIVEKIEWLFENWDEIWTNIGDTVKTVFENMKEFIKTPLNWIIEKVNSVFASLGEIEIPDWVPVIGGQSFSLPQIPTLAEGGLVDEGQMFIAREAGPELVGTYGGRNAVMNNDQIVAAVSKGVASAVASVLGSQTLAEEIAKALENANITAHIDRKEAFREIKNENDIFRKQTGYSAYA